MSPTVRTTDLPEGLCPSCAHTRTIRSAKGSVFLLCGLAKREDGFRKYPPQPVRRCTGWESLEDSR